MIHLLELCCLRTSNGLSLGVWWVSNILTHISYFPSWIVVVSSSFMCFNEFCECIGDLSTGIEINAKKHTKRSHLEQRRNIWKRTEPPPIDRSKAAYRSARNCKTSERGRAIADRSRHSSRSIGKFLRRITSLAPIDRELGADWFAIDRAFTEGRDRCVADRSANPLDAKRRRFPDLMTPNFHKN